MRYLALVTAVYCSFAIGAAPVVEPLHGARLAARPYYFPNTAMCTLMLDFQPSAKTVTAAKGDERSVLLAQNLIREYSGNGGDAHCKSAKMLRLVGVMVHGVDNYGRPDFSSRTNLIRLEGMKENVLRLDKISQSKSFTVQAIRKELTFEVLEK